MGTPVSGHLGPAVLKNVTTPVDLYAVGVGRLRNKAVDPVCRMAITARDAAARLRVDGVDWYFCSIDCARRFLEQPSA